VPTPKFTIVTPTYNRETLVQITIQSIIDQTYQDWELLIIDDGSTDNTEQAIQPFLKDGRISYFKKANSGQADSLNFGVSHATGEFIIFLDSDDHAYPNWLEVINRNIKDDTSVVCVGARRKLLDGTLINEDLVNMKFYGEFVRIKVTCGSLILKKHIFLEIGGYDSEMRSNIQTDLAYRLLGYLKRTNQTIVTVDEYLLQINVHDGPRIRTNWEKRRDGTKQFLKKHYDYLREHSPEDILTSYRILAFSSYKLRQRKESLKYLIQVIKINPFIPANYLKIIKYAFL
jgi:glycosyltransferase involved in cell wall biosynthesis